MHFRSGANHRFRKAITVVYNPQEKYNDFEYITSVASGVFKV